MSGVDRVANGAEDCADFFLGQRPEVPQDLQPAFLEAVRASCEIGKPLTKALDERDEQFGDYRTSHDDEEAGG